MAQITGELKHRLAEQVFTSKKGQSSKRMFVVQPPGANDKPIAFWAYGATADPLKGLKPGDGLTVTYRVESREYEGKWYTDAVASVIDVASKGAAPVARTATSPHRQPERAETERAWENTPDDDDSLPF